MQYGNPNFIIAYSYRNRYDVDMSIQTVTFCKKLNWDLLGSYLEVFASRLEYGVRDEIVPLVRIGPEVMPFNQYYHVSLKMQ